MSKKQTIRELVDNSETKCLCATFPKLDVELFGWKCLFINDKNQARLVMADDSEIRKELSKDVMDLTFGSITTIAACVAD